MGRAAAAENGAEPAHRGRRGPPARRTVLALGALVALVVVFVVGLATGWVAGSRQYRLHPGCSNALFAAGDAFALLEESRVVVDDAMAAAALGDPETVGQDLRELQKLHDRVESAREEFSTEYGACPS